MNIKNSLVITILNIILFRICPVINNDTNDLDNLSTVKDVESNFLANSEVIGLNDKEVTRNNSSYSNIDELSGYKTDLNNNYEEDELVNIENIYNDYLINSSFSKINGTDYNEINNNKKKETLELKDQTVDINNDSIPSNVKSNITVENLNVNIESDLIEDEDHEIPEDQSDEDHYIDTLNNLKSDAKEDEDHDIPEDQSDEDRYNKLNNDINTKNRDDYDVEDNTADSIFLLTIIILLIFATIFVYNLKKCYFKKENKYNTKKDDYNYSRELHSHSINDDNIIDI